MTRQQAIDFLLTRPAEFGKLIGFYDLLPMHNDWIISMVRGVEDETLQAHRGSYKTTCVSVALALIIILLPNKRTMFMRKTDPDTKEIIKQVQKILLDPHTQYLVNSIYNVSLGLTTQSMSEVSTNLTKDVKGTSQLVGLGLGSSITGKHFDRIFTDDIVNVNDRISKAERERTKLLYQELQNIKNKGGRIFNTGTPWHKEDAFTLMPNPKRFDCYSTGLMSDDDIADKKNLMAPSLFAANYELRHIASEEVLFDNPQTGGDPAMCEQGIFHLDSAFNGEDFTAWTVMRKVGDKFYVYGQIKRKHVDECYGMLKSDYDRFRCGKLYNETNADKGMVGKELRKMGFRVILYNEDMNKYLKIATYLRAIWDKVIFVEGTGEDYIEQVCEYYEEAEHDDAPDSLASLARLFVKKEKKHDDSYKPIWN